MVFVGITVMDPTLHTLPVKKKRYDACLCRKGRLHLECLLLYNINKKTNMKQPPKKYYKVVSAKNVGDRACKPMAGAYKPIREDYGQQASHCHWSVVKCLSGYRICHGE